MRALLLLAILCLASCAPRDAVKPEPAARGRVAVPGPATVAGIDRALREAGIVTAGFGLLQGGELVWSHYYGESSPGIPADAGTRFNAASITKTVTAETALRLVAQGELDLDAPLAADWVDPDVADDPRHHRLTARMVLDHTTGFPNWRFFRTDGRLAFAHAPGTHYGYSGEGFEYLARAIEHRLDAPFPAIVQRTVFDPVGMPHAVMTVHRGELSRVARPVDADGAFHGYYCRPGGWCRSEGDHSAADDMLVSVPDYARFLGAVVRGDGYGPAIAQARDRIATDRGGERMVDCAANPGSECPRAQGYGLGFEVADFGDYMVIGHGGADWAEQTLAYAYQPSGDGVIVFLNAPNQQAMAAMPEVLGALDPRSPFSARYRAWLAEADGSP